MGAMKAKNMASVCKHRFPNYFTNPGTAPITISAVNSDHGLSFARKQTRTMV